MKVEQRRVAWRAAQHATEAGRLGADRRGLLVVVRDLPGSVEVHLLRAKGKVEGEGEGEGEG